MRRISVGQWDQLVRGQKALSIPVDTGVGQASREVLDEKVAKEPAYRTQMVKFSLRLANHCCCEYGKADIPNIPRTSYDSLAAQI